MYLHTLYISQSHNAINNTYIYINEDICIYCDLFIIVGEGKGTPLQYSCLENPMDAVAWWAAAHGVAQSQT